MPSPKDILLVNPWIYDFTAYDFWLKPIGLLTIASVLRENVDCRLHFVDCLDRRHPGLGKRLSVKPDGRGTFPKEEVPKPGPLKDIPRKYSRYGIPVPLFEEDLGRLPRPDAVLMSCVMTYWYPGVQTASDIIRRRWPGVPIILGGLYATLNPEHARRESGADVVIQGLGENQILPFLGDILGDGLVHLKKYGGFEELPRPAFDLLRDRSTLPLLTSRGCLHRCSFCATPLLYNRLEQRPVASVIDEIESHVGLWGTENFAFYDDALLAGRDRHVVPLLEAVAQRKLPVAFHTPNGLQVREIDASLAALFRRSGVVSLYLSQESFDERLLGRACPKVTPGDLERALVHLEAAGYDRAEVNVYLIVGLIGQEASVVVESILAVRRLGARPRLAFYSPVPGTEEWKRAVGKGLLAADADPLLHNKLAFAYLWGEMSRGEFDKIRRLLLEEP